MPRPCYSPRLDQAVAFALDQFRFKVTVGLQAFDERTAEQDDSIAIAPFDGCRRRHCRRRLCCLCIRDFGEVGKREAKEQGDCRGRLPQPREPGETIDAG
ncbi:MAG TPA: hypothetical protein PKY30_14145 [Myxococcota bacterium]|nr:hypothetical protein [Myxococcota bacterium]